MKKHLIWLRLLAVAGPLLALLIFVNCYFDPANIFHNVSRSIADSLLDGNATYITSGNMNERLVKKYIIEDMPDNIECVCIGPSVVFGIDSSLVGTDNYYNLGVSGADYYDILAQFGLMEENNKHPERIILCLDTYFFDDILSDSANRNVALKPYAGYMMDILNGKPTGTPQMDTRAESLQRIIQMFSVTYFQSSIDYIKANKTLDIPRWGIASPSHTGTYYKPDGSMVHSVALQNSSPESVTKNAAGYNIDYHFGANRHISSSKAESFDKLVSYLKQQDTEVILFLAPMCPTLWDRCDQETYPLVWEVEAFANAIATKYDLEIVGSYNPYKYDLTDAAFYDARHLKHEYLPLLGNYTSSQEQ